MAKDSNYQFHLSGESSELIIREGQAPAVKEPVKIKVAGQIGTVAAFLSKRNTDLFQGVGAQQVSADSAIVIVDRKNLKVTLELNPSDPDGTIITGQLQESDELKLFGINANKLFNREELVKLLRFNRLLFADMDQHDTILKAAMSFTAKANTNVEASSDTRGNRANAFQRQVESNAPTEFVLRAPIFKGQAPATFRVEICMDVTDAGPRFWFESVELHEVSQTLRDTLIDEQLEHCKSFPILEL